MQGRYLLDTNIVSDLIRNPQGVIYERICAIGSDSVCINVIIAGEISFGLAKRKSARLTRQANIVLSKLEIHGLDSVVHQEYADIRLTLETSGNLIGPNDLWIAAHARSMGFVLVTDNSGEFSRVKGLRVENWLK